MGIGDKIVEVGLAGASAAIASFAIYLWAQIETIEANMAELKLQMADIENIGEVRIRQMSECENLSVKIIKAEQGINLRVKQTVMELFEKRGCNILGEKN